ncbi:MAG: tetratricopeptide repeat protein [Bacteroidota bacterium]
MLRTLTKFALILIGLIVLIGCSRKKDKWLNRNFHAMGTHFNVLYNGNLALQNGLNSVNNEFTENFWELLPVERLQVTGEIFLAGEDRNPDFERAEEKAIKAIQKHGMNIEGKERNYQIDEAYLLLGKSRYYDQRFVPALDAFNNILNRYPTSDKINQVKVWREKSNMRLGNNEIAIKNLERHLRQEEIEGQDLADISAALAQCYINLEEKDSARAYLKTAAEYTKVDLEKARYNFIIGQLFDELEMKDSANYSYDKIIELHRKIPRAYYINAHLAKARNFDFNTGDPIEFEEYLIDMTENRENRPYLDKIYHGMGYYYQSRGSEFKAEMYYEKSLRANSADRYLNARNYNIIGDMYFDRKEYKTAGAYFDSTLTNMTENTRPYRAIKKKRDNLQDVIYYEGIATTNDSILRILDMSEVEKTQYFSEVAAKAKLEEQKRLEQEELERQRQRNAQNNVGAPGVSRRQDVGIKGASENFYFYNPTTVAYGKNEFEKIWGRRQFQDNWRLSIGIIGDNRTRVIDSITPVEVKTDAFDPSFYISQLPQSEEEIDTLVIDRNYAYYQLGIIYKEKFREYGLSQSRLETLLDNDPEERLVLPAKYNLYKVYELRGLTSKADELRAEIIRDYPDSRYAEILLNPDAEISKDENSPEQIYNAIYRLFEAQEYEKCITRAEQEIIRYEGEDIVPKLELLKATASGRLYGFEAYKEGIAFVALTYPNREEGQKAEKILQEAIPTLADNSFLPEDDALFFNLVYGFDKDETKAINKTIEDLESIIEDITYYDLSVSLDVYSTDKVLVIVHGFKNLAAAASFGNDLTKTRNKKRPTIKRDFFAISSPNYAIVQRHKNLESYLKPQ